MKNLYLLGALLMCLIGNAQCSITNGDFENTSQYSSTFFTFRHGQNAVPIDNCHLNTANIPVLPSHSTVPNQFDSGSTVEPEEGTWVFSPTNSSVFEPMLSTAISATTSTGQPIAVPLQIPIVSSGNRAIKLNRSTGGSDVTTMRMQITSAGTSISFDYSILMDHHPGTPSQQAFFTAKIYNSSNDIVSTNEICIKADPNDPLFSTANIPVGTNGFRPVLFTGWNCGRLEIPAAFTGQNLTLEFIITDCTESGHFGTVYIDNVQCSAKCAAPETGFLSLNEFTTNCTSQPFQICGTYSNPEGSTLNSNGLILTITDSNNNLVMSPITTTTSLTSSTFCFTVNPALFSPTAVGNYDIRVDGNFTHSGGYQYELFDTSSGVGPDIISTIDMADTYGSGQNYYWPDIADSYELQFVSDGVCCPNNLNNNEEMFYTLVTTDNFFNVYDPSSFLASKCYRWRIKTSCGSWSDWCCLTFWTYSTGVYPGSDFVNFYSPKCYDTAVQQACDPSFNATISVTGIEYEQREVFITAQNTIEANGRATYQAGNYIQLNPGFLSQTGSVFLGKIANCTGIAGQTSSKASTERKIEPHTHDKEDKLDITYITPVDGYKVYPNPAHDKITIESIYNSEEYSIFDINGREIMKISKESENNAIEVSLSQLSAGIYFLHADGKLIQKIIKK